MCDANLDLLADAAIDQLLNNPVPNNPVPNNKDN